MAPHAQAAAAAAAVCCLLLAPGAGEAWTAETREALASYAVEILPPDLARQIERHRRGFDRAVAELDGAAAGGQAALVARLRSESEAAVQAIERHRPFEEIIRRLGLLAGLAAELNDPVAADGAAGHAADYARYLESARPRFAVLLYSAGRDIRSAAGLEVLLRHAAERSGRFAPEIRREYRRVAPAPGSASFDDRSTAFGIGSVSFSHGVSDIVAVLRYVWLRAGGSEEGDILPLARDRLVLLSKAGRR